MKKILALLLIGIICLSFVACGNNAENDKKDNKEETNNTEITANENDKKAIIGIWKDSDNNELDFTLTINDNGTGNWEIYDTFNESKIERIFTWRYSYDLDCYVIIQAGNSVTPVYIEYNCGNEYILFSGEKCYRI